MFKPDYERGNVKLYRGDARRILHRLPDAIADVVITDPPWKTKRPIDIPGTDNAAELLRQVAWHFPRLANRAIIHFGAVTDPRTLLGIPRELPFVRVCVLRYAPFKYAGKLLLSADFAYVFGDYPKTSKTTIPGECIKTQPECRDIGHPCPRRIYHLEWLVKWYASGLVLDPFMGSGTTGFAAVKAGLPFIGIELVPEFFDIAVERIEAAFVGISLTEHRRGQQTIFQGESNENMDIQSTG